jgi:hypothetical protein
MSTIVDGSLAIAGIITAMMVSVCVQLEKWNQATWFRRAPQQRRG